MASSGPNYGTSFSDAPSGAAWSNLANLGASDDAYATASISAGSNSRVLTATGFGFNIPGGATINGIVLEIERKAGNASALTDRTNIVFLTKDGSSGVGTSHSDTSTFYTTSDVIATYGSSADLWGTTWTAAEINASTFGHLFAATNNTGITQTASVDMTRITVYYTPASNTLPRIIGMNQAVHRASHY